MLCSPLSGRCLPGSDVISVGAGSSAGSGILWWLLALINTFFVPPSKRDAYLEAECPLAPLAETIAALSYGSRCLPGGYMISGGTCSSDGSGILWQLKALKNTCLVPPSPLRPMPTWRHHCSGKNMFLQRKLIAVPPSNFRKSSRKIFFQILQVNK